jgi:RNA exonuclease 1
MAMSEKHAMEADGFSVVTPKKAKRAKKNGDRPEFSFDGKAFTQKGKGVVQIKDVRDLCLNLLVDAQPPPSWILTANKKGIDHVVLLFAPGVTPQLLGIDKPSPETCMPQPASSSTSADNCKCPIFPKLFTHYCPTKAPGDRYRLHSCMQTMLTAPVPPKDKEVKDRERQRREQPFVAP